MVIPGFAPKHYPGYYGVPPLPVGSSQLAPYHFSQLAASGVTASALQPYDTVLLYGIKWSDIPATGQAAINAFAETHKVLIWDADGTGSQNYSTFIHPFNETASGENFPTKPNDSVVTFPSGVDFLASDNPSSPYYLDPNQLVTDKDELNDMSVMTTGTQNWLPALFAANKSIPNGGWVLAWSYGVIGNHTGLTVYSGIDADAFGNASLNPNYAIKALALQLAAPFSTAADPSCAPNCGLTTSGSGGGHPYVSCSFAKRIPRHWVHGRVAVFLKTSVAAGISGRVVTLRGRTLASAREASGSVIRLVVDTRRLRSNRIALLRANVFVSGQQACSRRFRLKVDNTRPRLLLLRTSRTFGGDLLRLRVSERSSLRIVGRNVPRRRPWMIAARRTTEIRLPATVHVARLILRDRAGNALIRKLHW